MLMFNADELFEKLGLTVNCEDCKHHDKDYISKCENSTWMEVCDILDYMTLIDAVPVIRCRDCKWWDKDTLRHNSNDVAEWDECECEMLARRDRWNEIDRYCCDMHFCADGERKDDE